MRQATCAGCGLTTGIRSFYSFEGKTYCEPCVWRASREAKENGRPTEYVSLQDNSVCVRCGISSGESDFLPVRGKPLCPGCCELIAHWPYPSWLKVSLAILLLLLVVALVHGKKYFLAGSNLYKGERLVREGRFSEALPYLQRTVATAPESDKGVLLLAKAALETGDIRIAQEALNGHNHGHFEDGDNDDFREVDAVWNRAVDAMDKADRASKLAQQDGKAAEAAALMHEAAQEYPQMAGLAISATAFDEGAAFESKNYDLFLSIAEKLWAHFPGSETAASVASALACKYAVTGNVQFREQAQAMLDKSRELAATNPEQQKAYQEYAERIEYRLKSKEIISPSEYNRRFRSNQARKE